MYMYILYHMKKIMVGPECTCTCTCSYVYIHKNDDYAVAFLNLMYTFNNNTFTEDIDGGVSPLVTVTGKSMYTVRTTCTCVHVCMSVYILYGHAFLIII